MKKGIALLAMLIVLGLLAGCSSKRVVFDYSESADFTQFRTFQYESTNTTLEAQNQLIHTRIVEAIRRNMTASGLTEVDNDPDVYVSYYGSTSEEVRLNTTYMGYSNWSSGHRHSRSRSSMGMSSSTTTATTLTTGTLLIDIWDAQENVLIWRGEVSDSLSGDPGRDSDRINQGVESVLANFPPK
jgi:hypothetical protein